MVSSDRIEKVKIVKDLHIQVRKEIEKKITYYAKIEEKKLAFN